jgi:hypothetical protein
VDPGAVAREVILPADTGANWERQVNWKPEVLVGGKWVAANGLRLATAREAAYVAKRVHEKWGRTDGHRAAPTDEPVNYTWHAMYGMEEAA